MYRTIRVLVADDHAVVRAGVARVLENADDVVVVGEAADGADAVKLAAELEPDVILMDLSMPVMDGIEATWHVRDANPAAQVVVLTSFSDRERILRALDAGAIGYLLKDASPDDLERGIRAAARGESPLDPRAAGALLGRERPAEEPGGLSPREREVLALVAEGRSNSAVAARLVLAERTVESHMRSIFQKLRIDDAPDTHRRVLAVLTQLRQES